MSARPFMRAYGWPCVAAAALALMIEGVVALLLDPRLSDAADEVSFMKAEVAKLDRELEDIRNSRAAIAAVTSCRAWSVQLHENRTLPVKLLDDVARLRPDGVRLTSLEQYGGTVELKGDARSYLAISELFDRADGSQVLELPRLKSVTAYPGGGSSGYAFAFDARMRVRGRPEGSRPAPLAGDARDPR